MHFKKPRRSTPSVCRAVSPEFSVILALSMGALSAGLRAAQPVKLPLLFRADVQRRAPVPLISNAHAANDVKRPSLAAPHLERPARDLTFQYTEKFTLDLSAAEI
jgi:hypothetical protein